MSGQSFRLVSGGLVDRRRPLRFRFDGQDYEGFAGDTLASALLANGVRLVGRSFKYHRPRGILTAGSEEPNALVALRSGARREPNTKATTVELYDGLEAASQNRWPSLAVDLLSLNGLLSPLFVAGFYYKTFMWPAKAWEALYEPLIRRAAGLGRASGEADPDAYEKSHAFCDVLVIGGGRSGLAAALAAAREGKRVIVADEDMRLGGRALTRPGDADALAAMLVELAANPRVTLMPRTCVFGVYDGGVYGALEKVSDHLPEPAPFTPRQRLWKIIATESVLAAGALERPIPFADNDRPGVMLAGAVATYLHRFGVVPGRRAIVYTSTDEGWRLAADLFAAGVTVEAVVDVRGEVAEAVQAGVVASGARRLVGARVARALGGRALRGARIVDASGAALTLRCDLLAVSGGWTPNLALTHHHGGRPRWDEALQTFLPGAPPPGMRAVGRAAGEGLAPLADLPAPPAKGKTFIDFQHDVTAADIRLAEREGYRSVEHVKRYTTLGMATDQGRTANLNGLMVLAEARGAAIPDVGLTMARPPYAPVAIGALAGAYRGRDFRPIRLPAAHGWAVRQGAVFVETGQWLRAQYFPRAGETDWLTTVSREVTTVRSSVGLCDVSTLGKIDVQGADAAAFLERVYINGWASLAVGRARYGVMLREDGFVMDDGTTARLAADHFILTTTTANAARVFQHLEYCHQVLWPTLDVQLASVTDQWAQFAIAGPRSRETLARLVDAPFDLANEAFPYMGAAELSIGGGLPARLFRISFSGELAYELAVPARYGEAVAAAIMAAGADFGICAYGTEALGVMRIEKGHAAGAELSGQTTATDLGLGRMLSKTKDFIGRRMAERPALTDPARPRLVGLRPLDPAARLRAGAHLVALADPADAAHDAGYVTSAAFSPGLGQWIGLGLLAGGPDRLGERVRAVDPVRGGPELLLEVCAPCFIDSEGARLRV